MSVRERFVADFGEDQAAAIERAAEEHKNGIHDNPGSDYFRWALVICVGYDCMKKDPFRQHHGITVPWETLRPWIKEHGQFAEHDGDTDYLSLMIGVYNWYAGRPEFSEEGAP